MEVNNDAAKAIIDNLATGMGYLDTNNQRKSFGGSIGAFFKNLGIKWSGESHIKAFKERSIEQLSGTMKELQKDVKSNKIPLSTAISEVEVALKSLRAQLKNYRHGEGAKKTERKEYLGSETNGSQARFHTYDIFKVTPVKTPKGPGKLESLIDQQLKELGVDVGGSEDLSSVYGKSQIIEE